MARLLTLRIVMILAAGLTGLLAPVKPALGESSQRVPPSLPVFRAEALLRPLELDGSFERTVLTELRSPHQQDTLVWRSTLHNTGTEPLHLVLELRNPFLRAIQCSLSEPDGVQPAEIQQAGAALPFASRPLPVRYFAFPLQLPAGESRELELRLINEGLRDRVVVELLSAAEHRAVSGRRSAAITAYLSAGLFSLVFGSIILAAIRERIRISYTYYFAVGLALVAVLQGLGFQYLWPNQPEVQALIKPLLLNATFLGGLRFLQRFFQTPERSVPLNKTLFLLMLGFGLFSAAALWLPGMSAAGIQRYQQLNDVWYVLGVASVLAIPLWHYRRTREREALLFLAAYAVLLIAALTGIGSSWGLYRTGPMLDAWIWAGLMLLHFFISLVILQRMRRVVLDQARARRDLEREKHRQLRDLVLHEELERERIGSDLHDEAGTRFASIKMALSAMAYRNGESPQREALQSAIVQVDQLCELNRSFSHRLLSVSLNRAGIAEALREYQVRLRDKGRHVVFRPSPGTLENLSDVAGMLLYRAVVELVEGVYEHAPSFRVQLHNSPDTRELVLTAEPIDEPLEAPDTRNLAFQSLSARLALFHTSREEPLQLLGNGGLRLWLPRSVETGWGPALAAGQEAGKGWLLGQPGGKG
jgi:signal transduction histidine kinase